MSISAWVLDTSGDFFSVQFSSTALQLHLSSSSLARMRPAGCAARGSRRQGRALTPMRSRTLRGVAVGVVLDAPQLERRGRRARARRRRGDRRRTGSPTLPGFTSSRPPSASRWNWMWLWPKKTTVCLRVGEQLVVAAGGLRHEGEHVVVRRGVADAARRPSDTVGGRLNSCSTRLPPSSPRQYSIARCSRSSSGASEGSSSQRSVLPRIQRRSSSSSALDALLGEARRRARSRRRARTRPRPRRAASAITASSAGRLPWMS